MQIKSLHPQMLTRKGGFLIGEIEMRDLNRSKCNCPEDGCLLGLDRAKHCFRVYNALLYAQCCIAEGNPEGARQPLQFVIDWGNRLDAVQIAKELMCQLSVSNIN